ncbi:MAG: gluconeogenesis factor YvcK family protein [Candidatus Acidiferrales bacterium]
MKKSTRHLSGPARSRPARIVALGGGTGLSAVLRGLKEYVAGPKRNGAALPIGDLTAIVTVTDDGGSSGRLRREYSVLPPGDIRNCMVALSKDEHLLGELFQYRFPAGRGLAGHSFGNLFLTALTNITGDFSQAIQVSAQVLAIRGRIFPSTAQNVTLEAELENGIMVAGETNISRSRKPISRVRLVPRRVRPVREALDALRQADLILVGPGSLYTSLIPNLLVEEIVDDHHTRPGLFDFVVINRRPVTPRLLRRYRAEGAEPVDPSLEELDQLGLRYVSGNLLQEAGVVRHDQGRLTRLLIDHFVKQRPGR